MQSNIVKFIALFLLLFIYSPELIAGELTYKPINPAFGGNPFNGSYLLGNAQENRQHEAPVKDRDSLEDFKDRIQSSLLSTISREISDMILGEDAKDSGSFSVGSTQIDFRKEGAQVVIDIADTAQGSQTTITLPVPNY